MSTLADHIRNARDADVRAAWRDRAACKGRPALMDPPPGQTTPDRERGALELCWACPAHTECRAWVLALSDGTDPGGVCGGLTEDQRRRWRRAAAQRAGRQRAANPPPPVAPEPPPGTLRCSRCAEFKPDDLFVIDRRNRPRRGRGSCCRTCAAAWHRDYKASRKGRR